MVLIVCIPIVIQNGFTNLASLLDNIMIGQLGTLSMSGVSISNQLFQVFNVSVFGAMSVNKGTVKIKTPLHCS